MVRVGLLTALPQIAGLVLMFAGAMWPQIRQAA
jgi:hypothetical protein